MAAPASTVFDPGHHHRLGADRQAERRGHRQHRDRIARHDLRQREGLRLHLRQHGRDRTADLRTRSSRATGPPTRPLNSYSAFYANNVDGLPGAYGMVLPNLLPTGVRRVERRSLATSAMRGMRHRRRDGLWPSGAQTVNPGGGSTAIVLSGSGRRLSRRSGLGAHPLLIVVRQCRACPRARPTACSPRIRAGQSITISSIVSSDTSGVRRRLLHQVR